MDRVAIFVVIIMVYLWLVSRGGHKKSALSTQENAIAIYIFSCCFSRLFLPVSYVNTEQQYGSFGPAYMLWPYFIFVFYEIWVIFRHHQSIVRKPKPAVIFGFIIFSCYVIANPNNEVMNSSYVALFFLCTLLIFLYCTSNAFDSKTIIRGIYKGLAITVVLHTILVIMYPLCGMKFMITFFNEVATGRGADRFDGNGTFSHANGLGVYASYYFIFFLSCAVVGFRRKKSYIFMLLSVIVIWLTGSRSAFASILVGSAVLVVFYIFRRYSLLNPKIFLRGVLPVLVVGAFLIAVPLSSSFDDVGNLDEMATYRLMHYYCAGEILEDHPLVGVGLNSHLDYLLKKTSAIDFEQIFDTSGMWEADEFLSTNPVHNIWLILLAELGIIGFLPILGFVVYYFYSFKRRIKNSINKYYHIVTCTGLGILCCLLVQGNSDWNPLTQQELIISLMFFALSFNKSYASEEHNEDPEFQVESQSEQPITA